MTRIEAARLIATEGSTHTCVAYFVKKTDGQPRRMVCRYAGDPIVGGTVRVWDLEKGAWRRINLDGVSEVKVLGTGCRQPARTEADRAVALERARTLVSDFG